MRSSSDYIGLVRENTNFRYLWFGQIISLLGDWFNLIASASLVASLTGSGLAVGGLFAVRMLAPFLISPVAGVAADRFNRKALLIFTDLARALTVLGFLLVRRPDQVWLLFTLTGLQLALSGIFFPTRNAILPDIVSAGALGTANALSSATWSIMLALGAALGGLVTGGWGVYPAFSIDALTFLVSAAILSMIKHTERKTVETERASDGEGQFWKAIRQYFEGLRYLKENPDILVIALQKAAKGATVFGVFPVVQVALAEQVFVIGQGGGTGLGVMYAVVGLGTGLGPILARRSTGDRPRLLRIAIRTSYLITAVGLAIAAPLISFPIVLFGTLLRAYGDGVTWVFSSQLLLQFVPDRVRGRVFATEFALFTLATASSSAVGGWLLDRTAIGISGLLWWTAGITLIPGLLWALWNRKINRAGMPFDPAHRSDDRILDTDRSLIKPVSMPPGVDDPGGENK